eukprot:jgi/Mesvir1/17112/Mv07547-RA.1
MEGSAEGRVKTPAILSVEQILGEHGLDKLRPIAARIASLDWYQFLEFLNSRDEPDDANDNFRGFDATECIVELVRFLILKAVAERPDALSPTILVDVIWHKLLLFPRLYNETFPVARSSLWNAPSADIIVAFYHDGIQLVTMHLPRTMPEKDVLAILSDIMGIPRRRSSCFGSSVLSSAPKSH